MAFWTFLIPVFLFTATAVHLAEHAANNFSGQYVRKTLLSRAASDDGTRHRKIAIVTFLSSDPKPGSLQKIDGAGVLAESVRIHMGHLKPDLLAIVTPNVKDSRPLLEKYGWTIRELPHIDLDLIQNDKDGHFRKEVKDDGCCGADEMLKMEAYRMTEYDRVVVMDTDTTIHSSFEELFDHDATTLYTAPFKVISKEPLQGAFLVVKPNVERFDELMGIFYSANFVDGTGWNASGVGWNYGGRTVQGILPYFLQKVHPEESELIDHCIYNNNAPKDPAYGCTDFHETKVNHFTTCQKPWYCYPVDGAGAPCSHFTKEWWKIRQKLAMRHGKDVKAVPCDDYKDGISPAYEAVFPDMV